MTVNAGSTSIKISLVRDGESVATYRTLDEARSALPEAPALVAHRIVYGGGCRTSTVIDDEIRRILQEGVDIDPVHQQPALDAVDDARGYWPGALHVACLDSEFHASIPAAARSYALPEPWRAQVPALGFHGLSFAWSATRIAAIMPDARRVVVAHLGGGSSLCGLLDGRSQVTTMGFTPLDGLVMATRTGRIDPGAVLWLSRHADTDLSELLSRRSGLAGLCGTPDMREVLDRAEDGDRDASFAVAVWLHRLLAELGGCVAALGGLDALVFTGGIGEHAADLRRRVCGQLRWLGVDAGEPLDVAGGRPGEQRLSSPSSAVGVFVIPAREDLMLARGARSVAAGQA